MPPLRLMYIVAFVLIMGTNHAPEARAQSGDDAIATEFLFPLTTDHVHGSTLVELPGGDLLAGWFQGSGERQADDVAIMGARKEKGNPAWSTPFVLADVPAFPDINPVLFVDGDERLWLLWYTVLANQWETSLPKYRISTDYADGAPQWQWQDVLHVQPGGQTEHGIQPDDPFVVSVTDQLARYTRRLAARGFFEAQNAREAWNAFVRRTHSNASGEDMMRRGRRYTDTTAYIAQPMGYPYFRRVGWQTRNKPLLLADGSIIVPTYSDGFGFSLMAITHDGGRTWESSAPLVGAGNIQPTLGQRRDGTLVALMRDNGPAPKRLHISTSSDGGLTWSDVHDTDLNNPGSAADLVVLNSGTWLLVWNDTEAGRHRLTAALSDDEGHSWPVRRDLEYDGRGREATRSHYPAVIQDSDGMIHVLYSFHHEGDQSARKTIKHAQFNEAWVRGQ